MKYDGRSQTVKAFLVIHADVADAIHAICPTRGEGVYENHSTDALECLLGTPDQESPGHSTTSSASECRNTSASSDE
ncbi:hypothetical protein SPF06_18550 [Sinomonas sp. JGH33]|uniref:Uncharacterized protein n=1 Tax=Sinomonas terricola TaxID=3110330 RepID=A0ABU5TAX1_9MICC|nr:hypothetical protein [Sinomonas sp. JGH33]MEA5456728.1 hypothetical protein [Sinomonas sp. JGH33]